MGKTESQKKWRENNREAYNAYMRDWRAKNRDRAREISVKGNAKYVKKKPATRRKSAREYNQRVRAQIIEFFGNKCVRCGFSDLRALQLDHKKGGGTKYRIKNEHNSACQWKMIKENPEQAREIFQLLCANCNFIKRDEEYEYSNQFRSYKQIDAIIIANE